MSRGYIYTVSVFLLSAVLATFAFYAYTSYYNWLVSQRVEAALPRAQAEFDFVASQVLDLAKNRVRVAGNSTYYNVTVMDVLPHRADNMDFFDWSSHGYYLNGSYYNQSHSNMSITNYFSHSGDGMNTTFRLSVLPPASGTWQDVLNWRRMDENRSNFTYTKGNTQNMSISVWCYNSSTIAPNVIEGSDTANPYFMQYADPARSYGQNALASGQAGETVRAFFIEFNSSAPSINFTLWFVNEVPVLEVWGGARCDVNVTVTTSGLDENWTAKYDFNTRLSYYARAADIANITKSAVIGKYIRDPMLYAAPVDDSQP